MVPNLNFNRKSPFNDTFNYDTWRGCYNLVKLNLCNAEVKEYLFEAVLTWISEFDIDGLRLDCADCLNLDFMRELVSLFKEIKPDFFIMGEVCDNNLWSKMSMLDSVINYVAYKGLYSSHNDKNYFEITYTLENQFGDKFV